MDDLEAIRLFEADGGIAREWHAVDQLVRNHWRKVALEKTEPGSLKTTSTPQVRGLVQRLAPAFIEQPKLSEVGPKARLGTQ